MDNQTTLGISIGLVLKGLSSVKSADNAIKGLARSAKNAGVSVKSISENLRGLKGVSKDIARYKQTISDEIGNLAGTLAKTASLAVPIKFAIDDEAAFADVKKYVDGTDEEMARLKGELRNLSASFGKSFSDVAAIASEGGKANLSGDELIKYVRLTTTAMSAFAMSANDVGKATNNMFVGFGIKNTQGIEELFDTINLLDNKVKNANADQILEATSLLAATARMIDLDGKTTAAFASTLLSTGKATSVVGTSLNDFFTTLASAEKQPKKFHEALKQIGLDAKTLKENLNKDSTAAMVDFLERIKAAPKDAQAGILYDLVGGNYNDEIASLVQNIDELKSNIALARSAEAKGSMEKELQVKLNTTASALDRLKQSWINLASSIGETFLPVIELAAKSLAALGNMLRKFNEKFPTLSKLITGAVGGFIALGVAISGVKIGFAGLMLAFAPFRTAYHIIALMVKGMWALGAATLRTNIALVAQKAALIAHAVASKAAAAAMAILRGTSIAAAAGFRIMKLALITTGIGAIVVGLATAAVWLYENWDRVKAFFQNFWQKIKPEWEGFKSWLDSWIKAFSSVFDETVAWWKDLFADFFGWIGEKIDWVLSSVKSVGEFFGFGDNSAPVMTPAYANADRNFTPAPNHPMGEALSTLSSSRAGSGNTNITFSGDFKIDAHGGSIDTEAFKRQISKDVQEAIRRNERNAKNTDVRD